MLLSLLRVAGYFDSIPRFVLSATNHTVKEISAVRTTPRPSATTKRPKKRPTLPGDSIAITDNDIYLWLPLIAVVIFTAIMVILVMVGRQKRDNAGYTAQRNPSGECRHVAWKHGCTGS